MLQARRTSSAFAASATPTCAARIRSFMPSTNWRYNCAAGCCTIARDLDLRAATWNKTFVNSYFHVHTQACGRDDDHAPEREQQGSHLPIPSFPMAALTPPSIEPRRRNKIVHRMIQRGKLHVCRAVRGELIVPLIREAGGERNHDFAAAG